MNKRTTSLLGLLDLLRSERLNGFRRGIIGMVISLFAFAAAFYFAPQFGLAFEDAFSNEVGTTGVLNRVLTIAAAGITTYVAFNLVSSLVLRVLLGKTKEKGLNNGLGFLAGGLQSAAAVLFFLGGFLILEPTLPEQLSLRPTEQPAETDESAEGEVAESLTSAFPSFDPNQALAVFRQQVNDTQLRPWVEKYNPFVHMPQLNTFEQVKMTVGALSDPNQVRRILLHPSIKELQEQPETKEAMLLLVKDPEVAALLKSKDRLNADSIPKALAE